MSRTVRVALLATVAWLVVFLVVPLAGVIVGNVRGDDFSRVLANPATWRVVWFSTWQSVLSVAATFAVAAPITWLIGRHQFAGRRALRAVTTVGF